MKEERISLYIGGINLIAAFYRGRFQGKLHSKSAGQLYRVTGNSIDEVVSKLKKALYTEEVQTRITASVRQLHHEHILGIAKSAGVDTLYVSPSRVSTRRYVNHCWNCKQSVDNLIDLSCGMCGWVICSRDGACGCKFAIAQTGKAGSGVGAR